VPETYDPYTWSDGTTPIDAARLNAIEAGIESMDDRTAALEIAPPSHTHAASDLPSLGTRTQSYSATPTIDPTVAGDRINMTATGNITAYGVSTAGAGDGQTLQLVVLASTATRTVTFASAIRTSTGVTRGPYTVASGQILRAVVEYSTLTSAWTLLGATVSAT
jgi:hypothetical protein